MDAEGGLNFALTFHASAFAACIVAYYKYGDRTEIFERSLDGTESALAQMRRLIAYQLGVRLKPVFDGSDRVVEITIVDPLGNPAREVSVSPVGSERYNDALFDFVESSRQHLVDYRTLCELRSRWMWWNEKLSLSVLSLMIIEAIISGFFGYFGKLQGEHFTPRMILESFLPIASIFVLGVTTPLVTIAYLHSRILSFRITYAAP
jgi:hypothetical protein